MTCTFCSVEIPAARLKAVPEATLCAECQAQDDVPLLTGYMSWEHKTAPELIIGPEADKLRAYDRRGFHAQLPLNSKNNPRMLQSLVTVNLSLAIREELPVEERNLVPVIQNPARCHPKRPRMNVAGDCLICALEKQALRVRS